MNHWFLGYLVLSKNELLRGGDELGKLRGRAASSDCVIVFGEVAFGGTHIPVCGEVVERTRNIVENSMTGLHPSPFRTWRWVLE